MVVAQKLRRESVYHGRYFDVRLNSHPKLFDTPFWDVFHLLNPRTMVMSRLTDVVRYELSAT